MSITIIIIVFTIIVSVAAFNNHRLIDDLAFNPYMAQKNKQWYRFLSSALVHSDYTHLVFNMLGLYFFGSTVEQYFHVYFQGYGSLYFLGLYIVGNVVSDIATYFRHRNNKYYSTIGASGAISAVIFSAILFNPWAGMGFLFLPINIPAWLFGIIILAIDYGIRRNQGLNINSDAHISGAFFGLVYTILLNYHIAIEFWQKLVNHQ
jgi:membrane associated rhomboid family serine protease